MDTKSRNSHKIAIIIIIITILLPSVGMILLYPYFNQEAENAKQNMITTENFLSVLIDGNYVLQMEEALSKSTENISPSNVFFPQYNSDVESYSYESPYGYDENFRSQVSSKYQEIKSNFMNIRDSLSYQVLDESQQVIVGNINGSLKDLLSEDKSNTYAMGAIITYDKDGNIAIPETYGNHADQIKGTLYSSGRYDPFYSFYNYNSAYEDNIILQNPQNRTFIYAMTTDNYNRYLESNNYLNYHAYLSSELIPQMVVGCMIFIAAIAMVLPLIKTLRTGNEKLFQAPCELVIAALFFLLALGNIFVELVITTNSGRIYSALQQANFDTDLADLFEKGIAFLVWSFIFFLVYWSISCLRGIFTLGPVRYWKERTILYRIFSSIKRFIAKIYSGFTHLDFNDTTNKTLFKIVGINFIILLIICSLWFFGIIALIIYSILLFVVLHKYFSDLQVKYHTLLRATNEIAEGNLDVTIEEDLGVFNPFKGEIQKIQSGFKKAVDEEVKSQRMKTDLVTNVSHDLKTPLTAIITYVNLLKDETDEEKRRAYTEVLDQKSLRLKSLIEDLFEISKATSNNVSLNFMNVDIVDLLKQVRLELSDKIDECSLDFRWNLPEQKIVLWLDSQKTYRVFENLLVNIIKYALEGTRVYIDMGIENEQVHISMKNISACELNFNPEEITERFVRGDASRNTEGSGLGLAIAKSFVDLQNGKLNISADADLFKVEISWPLPPSPVEIKDILD